MALSRAVVTSGVVAFDPYVQSTGHPSLAAKWLHCSTCRPTQKLLPVPGYAMWKGPIPFTADLVAPQIVSRAWCTPGPGLGV
jgi:hypothetical protein